MNKESIIQEIKQLIELNKEKILINNYQKALLKRFIEKEAEENHLEILIAEEKKNSREIRETFKTIERLIERYKKTN